MLVAAAGLAVLGLFGPRIVGLLIDDPQQWEPNDAEVRQALDDLPFPVRYRDEKVDSRLRWYRGDATRRGVHVRFAFLVGPGAAKRIAPPSNFHLLPGRSDVGEEAPSFKVVYQSDASLLPGATPRERARRSIAYDTSSAILEAVTKGSDD